MGGSSGFERLLMKTRKEALIELRNTILKRAIGFEADCLYWEKVAKKSKTNSPEKIGALQNLENQKESVKNDILYLECIDQLLKGSK